MKNFTKGFIKENPVFILLLGLCPTLAVTTRAIDGFGMGMATIFVLVASNIVISLIKGIVPPKIRIPIFIVVIASFVTIVDLFMQAFTPALAEALGIFIPLIVVNCIILGRAEAFASKNTIGASALDGLGMGLGFLISLVLLASIREFLGAGTVPFFLKDALGAIGINVKPFEKALESHMAIIMILPPGAFLTLGLLLGFINKLKSDKNPNTNTYTLMDNHVARRNSIHARW